MKITFSNLGNIKKTTLDLRPLTVIIGPNNTNKTYIAYSIYGMWQSINQGLGTFFNKSKLKYENVNTLSVEINEKFYEDFQKDCEQVVKLFKRELEMFFQDSSRKLFTQTSFELQFDKNEVKKALNQFVKQQRRIAKNHLEYSLIDNVLYIVFAIQKFRDKREFIEYGHTEILGEFYNFISLNFPNPLLLPAERNAFIITYKMLANRRYKLLKQFQRNLFTTPIEQRQLELFKEQGDIRYPQPIEDFLDFLTDVEFKSSAVRNSSKNNEFAKLAIKIEQHIQGANKTNLKPTKYGGKEIKINIKKGLNIDLYNASSSIKQLTPLLMYLRYRAKKHDLLIIDEPEMNLHPESQAKLLEILGILVNAGVNVLLTTHSPYFMSHLNNLVSGDITDEKDLKEQAKSLYLKDSRAFLSADDVSAYEMRNNKLHSLKDKDYGIRWDTLSDISAEIQQKFFEIHEKGAETSDGEEE
jgi:predicted ATPase